MVRTAQVQRLADKVTPHISNSMRRRVVSARLRARMPTARFRSLPDFLVIGGMRCGTSSLYKYLGYHPLVLPSLRKEIHYLSIDYGRGERWYRSHFPTRARKAYAARARGLPPLTFEATPDYIFHPHAPRRAFELVPEAKIIALLRNPVDRAISHHRHNVRAGWESLSLEEALEREQQRLAGQLERLLEDPLDRCVDYRRYSYVARGIYVDQLRSWTELYPRERVLVVKSEDLFERPGEAYREILDFLGLPEWRLEAFPNYSYRRGPAPKGDGASEEARAFLEEALAPHNRRLYDFLGRDLAW